MKWLNFKIIAAILLFSQFPAGSHAQENPDNLSPAMSAYHERLLRRQHNWERLIPNLFTLQYAGDIGMISAGIGWDYGPKDKWETHFLIGYLPPRRKYQHYWTFTLRETFCPWKINFGDRWGITPLSVSLSVNSVANGDFWSSEPDRYPKGYYGFSSRIRFHLGLGQRFNINIPEEKRFLSRRLSVYYEVSTCDLYIRQKALNSSIPLKDILVLGVGMIYTI